MRKSTQVIMVAAIAGMISGAPAAFAGKKAEKVHCYGVNACKGKGGCKTSANECKGQNGCKGKGMMEMTKAKCTKKKGTTEEPKAEEKKEG